MSNHGIVIQPSWDLDTQANWEAVLNLLGTQASIEVITKTITQNMDAEEIRALIQKIEEKLPQIDLNKTNITKIIEFVNQLKLEFEAIDVQNSSGDLEIIDAMNLAPSISTNKTNTTTNGGTPANVHIKSGNTPSVTLEQDTTLGNPPQTWDIKANHTAFSIQDTTAGTTPFQISKAAPTDSFYISPEGRIAIGHKIPLKMLHIKATAANPVANCIWETGTTIMCLTCGIDHIFVGSQTQHDVRIIVGDQPIMTFLPYSRYVGIGTTAPAYPFELVTTGENAALTTKRTDGATNFMSATASYAQFGAVTNHPVRILVNSAWKFMLNTDGSLSMANGATCTSGGVWTNASSRALKENIQPLCIDEALKTLDNLRPVKFNYKANKMEKHVGFIAEDVPDLVATKDRKGMSPMDVVAVLTKVLQEQQKILQEHQKTITELKEKISELEKKE